MHGHMDVKFVTRSIAMSMCPSVCPHGTILFPLVGFSLHLISEHLSKVCGEKFSFHSNLPIITGTLREYRCTLMILFAEFFLEWEMVETKIVEKVKSHILCSIICFFLRKCYRLWDNVEKYLRTRQATDVNIVRRMCFAWWISKATDTHSEYVIIIAFPRQQWLRERASVVSLYVHCLSCLFYECNSLLTNRFFYLLNGICRTCVGKGK